MASSNFPQRKSAGAGGMTGGDTSLLDGPPPTPAAPQGMSLPPGGNALGQAAMPSFEELAGPMTAGTPGRAFTPEIAMGLMTSGETIASMLDSFASIAPDFATDFALLKQQLQMVMGKILLKSGQTASPTMTGNNFPGGGFTSGF